MTGQKLVSSSPTSLEFFEGVRVLVDHGLLGWHVDRIRRLLPQNNRHKILVFPVKEETLACRLSFLPRCLAQQPEVSGVLYHGLDFHLFPLEELEAHDQLDFDGHQGKVLDDPLHQVLRTWHKH